MNKPDFRIERILHAFVDGELSKLEKSRLLVKMENDDAIRERACELRRTKEWVKFSFEGETAPTRSLPVNRNHFWNSPVFHVAASLLIAVLAFSAGWIGQSLQEGTVQTLAAGTASNQPHHVILHISDSDEARFTLVLNRTRQILEKYRGTDVQVEVVANAGGLDFLRTASSRHTESIKRIIAQYDNVRFIACSKGLNKLRESGLDAIVIEGVDTHEPAADHLIHRLTEGWTYIKI
ncbi:MAG TPA: hypothetical protein ENJ80_13330 [Gammaproteobacteria bacterium]|nr:hypothetical protein [Gammaproteobacteria bacterium]